MVFKLCVIAINGLKLSLCLYTTCTNLDTSPDVLALHIHAVGTKFCLLAECGIHQIMLCCFGFHEPVPTAVKTFCSWLRKSGTWCGFLLLQSFTCFAFCHAHHLNQYNHFLLTLINKVFSFTDTLRALKLDSHLN